MRLLHMSDLHLGKRVNEYSMLEEQRYILKEILEIADREQVQGILIAGDIYDKQIPPAEAVGLLDHFLNCLVNRNLPVFFISGNHDSKERLAFGAKIFKKSGVFTNDGTLCEKIKWEDEYGTLFVWLLPFLKPAYVKASDPGLEPESYSDAVRIVLQKQEMEVGERNILLAHQFVTGAQTCESEELSIGGLDQIDVSVLQDFDYVALGHLHRPQSVGRPEIRYSGTPLKYSFSEVHDKKSVTIVEIREKGNVSIHAVPLVPRRDFVEIRGTYLELTKKSFYETLDREAYYHITLTDEEDVLDAVSKLRILYPNLMKMDYDNKRVRTQAEYTAVEEVEKKCPEQLIDAFYYMQNGKHLSEEQRTLVRKTMESIEEESV